MSIEFYLKREKEADELDCLFQHSNKKWICEAKSKDKKRMQELVRKGAAILPPVSHLSILGGNNEIKEEQMVIHPHFKGNQLYCTLENDLLKCFNVSRQGNIT